MDKIFAYAEKLDGFIWQYLGIFTIIFVGLYLTFSSRFLQFAVLFNAKKVVKDLIASGVKSAPGVNPLKLYFASIGGMIGLGNLAIVVTTLTHGGPGSLFWMWVASILGMVVKYSEIYLGVKYRVPRADGYDGGPMYYLQAAFKNNILGKILPVVSAVLLCIYGVEISQFVVLTDTISSTFSVDKWASIIILLSLVLLSSLGGVRRLANICSVFMPVFMISYVLFGLYIIIDRIDVLKALILQTYNAAQSYSSIVAGLGGAAIHYGISRAVYSGDIGTGYDSIVQSETQSQEPTKQARLAILGLFTDTMICTITILIVMVTGLNSCSLQVSQYVPKALSLYIPEIYASLYTMALFFIAGYTTIIGYLVIGQKCARFISIKWGSKVYMAYVICAFCFFSFHNQDQVIVIMSLSGGCLMIVNLLGVWKLRKEIDFGRKSRT